MFPDGFKLSVPAGLKGKKKKVRKAAHPSKWSTDHFRAAKFKGDRCEACGSRNNLIAHHIDQNPKHNKSENIQTLCKPCHDFWHNVADRNDRKIAGKMPKMYQ